MLKEAKGLIGRDIPEEALVAGTVGPTKTGMKTVKVTGVVPSQPVP